MGSKVPCATVTPLRTEGTPYSVVGWCRRPDSNRHEGCPSADFESAASANSATSASARKQNNGAEDGIRTRDPLLGNWPPTMQAASVSDEAAQAMLAAHN